MRVIAATVLDPTHLELTEPLELRSGAQVAVAVHEGGPAPTVPATGPAEPVSSAPPRRLRFRERENEWRRTHGDVLREYAGQWLVLEGDQIVAHGDDPAPLVARAREHGIDSPYVFYVEPPRPPGVVKMGLGPPGRQFTTSWHSFSSTSFTRSNSGSRADRTSSA